MSESDASSTLPVICFWIRLRSDWKPPRPFTGLEHLRQFAIRQLNLHGEPSCGAMLPYAAGSAVLAPPTFVRSVTLVLHVFADLARLDGRHKPATPPPSPFA